VTDLFGVSGRRMLAALLAGERDPHRLAALARGRLRRKLTDLELALTGQCTDHHAKLIAASLELLDLLDRQIADLDVQIGELVTPLTPQLEHLTSIPGVKTTAARTILAEIGTDRSSFGTDARLASWTGLCSGNHESAGKRRPGQTRKDHRYLRRVLVPWAWATRTTPTSLGRTFRRLEVHLGGKKAAVAVAHTILVIIYHLLAEGTCYDEQRSDRLLPTQEDRQRKRAIKALEQLGSHVTVKRVA
jgi:transposase